MSTHGSTWIFLALIEIENEMSLSLGSPYISTYGLWNDHGESTNGQQLCVIILKYIKKNAHFRTLYTKSHTTIIWKKNEEQETHTFDTTSLKMDPLCEHVIILQTNTQCLNNYTGLCCYLLI